MTRPVYSAFYYWWRLKRRVWRAVVGAVRAAVVLVLAWLLLSWYWPEAGDEVRRFVVRTGKAVLQITGRSVRLVGEALEGQVRIFRGNEMEVHPKSKSPKSDEEPVEIFRGPPVVTLQGTPRVIDGDTLELNGARVRLHGIDAPESAQTCIADGRRWRCGQRAVSALAQRISGQSVACKERDRDRYGRIVAVCRAGGKDLNARMVSQGWALAYRRYSLDYVDEEASARTARRGVWRGRFVEPWDWREGVRLDSTRAPVQQHRGRTARPGASRCRIKGNISRKGARIYHVPGGRYYESTRISPSLGERWFCTEAEARAAGWRRSRR